MRTLRLFLPLLFVFALLYSSSSFAEWKKTSKNVAGDTFYVDFDRIRKHDGQVYYWDLTDRLKPSKHGDLSIKVYSQGDCKLFRYKRLSYVFHKEPMGEGTSVTHSPKGSEWEYPNPNSINEAILKSVCASAKRIK